MTTMREPLRAKLGDFKEEKPWTFWGIVLIGGGLVLLTVLYFPVMFWLWVSIGGLGALVFLIVWIVKIIQEWVDFY